MFKAISQLGLVFVLGLSAAAEAQERYEGSVSFNLSNRTVEDANTSTQLFEFRSQLSLRSNLHPNFHSAVNVEALSQTGSMTFTFQERNGPGQGFRLRTSYIGVHDESRKFQFKAGAFEPQLYMEWPRWQPIAFPGAAVHTKWGHRKRALEFSALQSVASANMASREVSDVQNSPSLSIQSLSGWMEARRWAMRARVFRFQFSTLPSRVAHFSRFQGNSITGVGNELSEFRYGFAGWGGSLALSRRLSSWLNLGLRVSQLKNTSAPDGINTGIENAIFAHIRPTRKIQISPNLGVFKSGSDMFPSFYMRTDTGGTNVEGAFAEVKATYLPARIHLVLSASQGQSLRDNIYQDEFNSFRINVVQTYDIF